MENSRTTLQQRINTRTRELRIVYPLRGEYIIIKKKIIHSCYKNPASFKEGHPLGEFRAKEGKSIWQGRDRSEQESTY